MIEFLEKMKMISEGDSNLELSIDDKMKIWNRVEKIIEELDSSSLLLDDLEFLTPAGIEKTQKTLKDLSDATKRFTKTLR